MTTYRYILPVVLFALGCGSSLAGTSASADYSITASTVDSGGVSATSTDYSTAGSVGGATGISTAASPAETLKAGYIGQLFNVTGLTLNNAFINDGIAQQLTALAALDDGTTLTLTGYSLQWSIAAGQLPDGLQLGATSGVLSGSPLQLGPYNFTVQVSDSFGHLGFQTFSQAQYGFSEWLTEYPQLSNKSPNATPQNDGVDNLLKYVFDLDPTQPINAAGRAAMPALSIDTTSVPGQQYLSQTFRETPELQGVAVTLQTSTDLVNWTTVSPPDLYQQVGTDAATGDPILEMGVLVAPGTKKQFVRINVSAPSP